MPTALAVLADWRTPARSTTTMGSVVLDGDAALLRVMTGSEWSAQEVAGLLR